MNTQLYRCSKPGRIAAVRAAAQASPPRWFNGIDYLEVVHGEPRLHVHFVHDLAVAPDPALSAANVEIRGGVRERDPRVLGVTATGSILTVELDRSGDFSTYELRLVASAASDAAPAGIDPALARIRFSFKVDCPSEFDCQATTAHTHAALHSPDIDYLARDYPSFRRLVLDRLTVLLPDWRERSPADLVVTLCEALAFRADEIAYFQDAVATEAYLNTARQRVSVRRHARLLDFIVHEGCNARSWVSFEVAAAADGNTLAACDADTGMDGTLLLTRMENQPARIADEATADAMLAAGAQPFELLTAVTLYHAHNDLRFYTWSDEDCHLPRGATRAFLRDDVARRLRLRAGDLLLLEARVGAGTGLAADADPQQRQVVRLQRVVPEAAADRTPPPALRTDPLTGQAIVEVHWHADDALRFDLCISRRIGGVLVADMAGASANVALADHGLSMKHATALVPVPGGRVPRYALAESASLPWTRQRRVRTGEGRLGLIDASAAATASMQGELADARAAVVVSSYDERRRWQLRPDLLRSNAHAADFVLETENDGRVLLRFGDGIHGLAPGSFARLSARMRLGNGRAGNVGAEAIAHVLSEVDGIVRVRNPLSAIGGHDPLPLARAQLDAPQAFRRQERAVTAADYAEVTMRDARVQRALATRRWTGSWYIVFITVDRRGATGVDAAFEDRLTAFIERYRLAGHDVEIDAPTYVALDIALHVCTRPGYFAADVHRRLLAAFSMAPGGFFHPDRYSFGDAVHLSAVVATAMAVTGVAHVEVRRFQRLGRVPADEIKAGRIAMARLEIARLDNDPNAPENGRIRFEVHETGVAASTTGARHEP